VADPLLWSYVEDQSEQHTERMQGFRSAVAPHELLPTAQLQRMTLDCMRHHPDLLSDYGRPSGYLDFKRQIARLAMEWGGQLHPEQLIVTQGTIEALNLALRALTQPGDVVAVESPPIFPCCTPEGAGPARGGDSHRSGERHFGGCAGAGHA
jgi:DNA-binding transcriptional MocR family regulator